jgi:ectoine hydroxylase-related dioxygenase (phytanoyl-CoA dioxygenase family)
MKNLNLNSLKENGFQTIQNLIELPIINDLKILSQFFKEKTTKIRKNVFENSSKVKTHFADIEKTLNSIGLNCKMTPYCFFLEKTDDKNWPLQFHQDTNFPAYLNLNSKEIAIWLKKGFWVRLNLDSNDKSTGAIKVIPKSHLNGKDSSFEKYKSIHLNVNEGDIILFKPLLYHGSDKMTKSWERRIFQCLFLEN